MPAGSAARATVADQLDPPPRADRFRSRVAEVILHEPPVRHAIAVDEDEPVGGGRANGAVQGPRLPEPAVLLGEVDQGRKTRTDRVDELAHGLALAVFGDDDLEPRFGLFPEGAEDAPQGLYVLIDGDDDGGRLTLGLRIDSRWSCKLHVGCPLRTLQAARRFRSAIS